MRLTDDTELGPKAPTRPMLVDWPTLANTRGRVWELNAPDDFEVGRARAVAESARSWGKRHGFEVSARVLNDTTVRVVFV